VDLCDFPQSSFKIATRLVLNPPVFDEEHEMMSAIFSDSPAKIVDVPIKCVCPSGSKCVTQPFLDFCLVHIQAHPIDGVF
jgi:hypothetical protein